MKTISIDKIHKQMQYSLNLQSRQPNLDRTIMRSGIRFYTEHCFKIPAPIVESEFSVYNLLYWSIKHTYHRIIEGMIEYQGTRYRVIYKNITRGFLLQAINNDCGAMQVSLSFRKPKDEWDIIPTVIIAGVQTA